MRSLSILIDAEASHCGNCHRLEVPEDGHGHRGRCGVFQVGLLRGAGGQFDRVTGCLAAEQAEGGAAA